MVGSFLIPARARPQCLDPELVHHILMVLFPGTRDRWWRCVNERVRLRKFYTCSGTRLCEHERVNRGSHRQMLSKKPPLIYATSIGSHCSHPPCCPGGRKIRVSRFVDRLVG